MYRLFILGLILPLLTLSSCGDDTGQDPEGTTFLMQERAFILPGTGNSCLALNSGGQVFNDVSEFRVALSNIKLTWTRANQDLVLIYFRIEIDHPNTGLFQATVDGVEMDLLLGTQNGLAGSATFGTLDADDPSTPSIDESVTPVLTPVILDSSATTFLGGSSKIPCSMTFGGIQIPDDTPFFVTRAEITLVGIARGNDKEVSELPEGEVPIGVLEEEAIKIERTVDLEFDFN
ncbi:MAG: hypothetical protein HRT44_00055 [Bdellovibrionales bacterium]|nr:hypothetical protein [Bdellovibrionales bacterium]NQZ17650.1 hypothetical protein [Bdellovibrionales bacterium]